MYFFFEKKKAAEEIKNMCMNRGCGDTCVFGIVLLRRGRVVRLVRVEEHDNLTGARIPDNMNFAVHKKYNHDGWDKISRHIYRVYMYCVCVCVFMCKQSLINTQGVGNLFGYITFSFNWKDCMNLHTSPMRLHCSSNSTLEDVLICKGKNN